MKKPIQCGMKHETQPNLSAVPPVDFGRCIPLRHHVPGSPFQPRDRVRVVAATDVEIHDVSKHIGRLGLVEHLEYSCGCGQRYPDYPAVGVKFTDGTEEEFWPEELVGINHETGARR